MQLAEVEWLQHILDALHARAAARPDLLAKTPAQFEK